MGWKNRTRFRNYTLATVCLLPIATEGYAAVIASPQVKAAPLLVTDALEFMHTQL